MDTEQQIAERLKQNIHRDDPTPAAPTPVVQTEDSGFVSDIGDNTNMYKLYDYFNVETSYRNGESEQKIQYIYRWAADIAQSSDYIKVAQVLTAYSQGQGVGQVGMSNLERMYQFVRLENEITRLRQEQAVI